MNTTEDKNPNLLMDSDESINIHITDNSREGSIDYDNPKIETYNPDSQYDKDSSEEPKRNHFNAFNLNTNHLTRPNKPATNPKSKEHLLETAHTHKYSAMLQRLKLKNVKLDDSVKRFRYNIDYERRNFLSLIKLHKLVCPKKIKDFLKGEVSKDKIHSGQSCMQCGIIYYLPSFQLLRWVGPASDNFQNSPLLLV